MSRCLKEDVREMKALKIMYDFSRVRLYLRAFKAPWTCVFYSVTLDFEPLSLFHSASKTHTKLIFCMQKFGIFCLVFKGSGTLSIAKCP